VSKLNGEHSLSLNANFFPRDIHKEIHMRTQITFIKAVPALGASIVACILFAANAAASDQDFPVDYRVNAHGLDLTQPSGAQELYARLQHAAQVVCTHGMRVDLVPAADPKACYEQALGNAVKSANAKLVTQVYLASHTSQEAIARGIDLPVRIAAK
jgi:UrcA family protein